MHIDSTLQIGAYHLQHCEDYLFHDHIGTDRLLCAVMDGCTMGTDSYFISTLVGKLLRKIVKERHYLEFFQPSQLSLRLQLKSIVQQLFNELKLLKNQLQLSKEEMLTTLIIVLVDPDDGVGLVVGDGVVSIDGQVTEFEQDNKPDYLGYHLQEDFDGWYGKQAFLSITNWQDISISTDGISSFMALEGGETDLDPVSYLLSDTRLLEKKLKYLEHEAGLRPTDDLAIIRVRNSRDSLPAE
ncbi:protein phosphatase 2C domain-containing protein [Chitinophaga sancti]|uniref:protein phosphatase 2C domain-containing protein n=1 Tax=Chitinophaga sancti TaxID=1004 RepID=UPI002A75E905|nr:protein phosphatase 2C domain-containing protein [Chitinophaga sancti]WPQ66333.1 protein phosphatase 2C domain-containing protein [Chitinophaga sancti]